MDVIDEIVENDNIDESLLQQSPEAIDELDNPIVPEVPKTIAGQQLFVYLPNSSNDNLGLVEGSYKQRILLTTDKKVLVDIVDGIIQNIYIKQNYTQEITWLKLNDYFKLIQDLINNITSGTTIVDKADKDSEGNVITDTYVSIKPQVFTEEQQAQARENIGAGSAVATMVKINDEFASIVKFTSDPQAQITANTDDIISNTNSITELEKVVENHIKDFESLFSSVTTINENVTQLQQNVQSNTEDITQNTSDIASNTTEINSLKTSLSTTNSNVTQNANNISTNASDIDDIEAKIPTQASSTNQLADKDFVNSSINNIAAFYITRDAQRNAFETHEQLFSATVFYSGGEVRVPTKNDYCIVRTDETQNNSTTRYIYDVNGWAFQYIVNETPLTAEQLAAINSGITEALVQQIGSNTSARHTHTNKSLLDTYSQTEDNLSDAVAKKHSHNNKSTLDATTASFTTQQQTKLAGIAEGANKTVVDSALSSTSTNPVQNKVVDNAIKTVTNALNGKVTAEEGKGLSSNDFTDSYKNKLDGIEKGAEVNTVDSVNGKFGNVKLSATDVGALPSDTPLFSGNYNDLTNKPTIPTDNNQLANGAGYITSSGTSANATKLNGKEASYYLNYNNLSNKPSIPTTASEINALPDTTKYASSISMTIDSTTYIVTVQLKDQDGNNLGNAKSIDLPLESVVVSGSYDSVNKKVILTLKDGSTIDFSVADLVSGLQPTLSDTQLSATNSGITSTKVQTYDAVAQQYLKNASVNSTGDTLTITKQDNTTVEFQGGGGMKLWRYED